MSENEYQDISTEHLERIRDLASETIDIFAAMGMRDSWENSKRIVQDACEELESRKAASDG